MTARRLAMVVWLATMALSASAAAILVATAWVDMPPSWGFRGASNLVAVTFSSVGAFVAVRRPAHAVGWLFLAVGALFAFEELCIEYVVAGALAVPGRLPGVTAVAWLLTWVWIPPVGLALIFLPLLFPSGGLPSPRWRPVAWVGAVGLVPFCVLTALAPGPIQQATFIDNPLGQEGISNEAFGLVFLPFVLTVGLAVWSLVRRFRAADLDARRQIKWFALASAMAFVVVGIYAFSFTLTADARVIKVFEVLLILAILSLPIAAGLAILRYRLYDIDRIISRTISYGAVTALLVAAYAGAVLVLQGPLRSITGGDTIPVAISTLVVAALFQPLRRRVQTIVDRRFDRARFDAERTTAAFADRLRDQVDLPMLAADLDATVRQAIAPSRVGLWLREADPMNGTRPGTPAGTHRPGRAYRAPGRGDRSGRSGPVHALLLPPVCGGRGVPGRATTDQFDRLVTDRDGVRVDHDDDLAGSGRRGPGPRRWDHRRQLVQAWVNGPGEGGPPSSASSP